MAKKTKKKETSQEKMIKEVEEKIPKEVKEKLMKVKQKLDKFKKKIIDKFDKYITGIALLPPPKPAPNAKPEEIKKLEKEKDKFRVLILVDDTEPHKMSKAELKEKISTIIEKTAKETDEKIIPQTILLTELWQNCYDGKYELLQTIAMSAPIHDTGMLAAIKIAEVHKTMVLKKFEKYIVAHVLGGSLVQGRATPDSDIDVFVVIDDTDVKKMTRTELKDKLRAIIIDMGFQAGEMTGIKNKLNVQVYILTDFWDSVKEANPVIFTFLRDGVPFFDRGIFMPWKQLLKMGKIKPSPEAIDMYMSSGEQVLDRVKLKLRDLGTEDFFWATFTPSQAALMLYGVPPPAPKETPEMMREIFVKKEKLLTESDVKVLDKVLDVRKSVEHGTKKAVTGKEIDDLVNSCDKYLKRLKKLFTQIEKIKEGETMLNIADTLTTVTRDILRKEGVEKASDAELVKKFDDSMIHTGKAPAKFLRTLKDVLKAKKEHDSGKLTKTDVDKARKSAGEYIRFAVEYLQRKRGKELERAKIRVKYGEKYGEVTILGKTAFIITDLGAEIKEIKKAEIERNGKIGTIQKSSFEDLEKALAKIAVPEKVMLSSTTLESLEKIFGKDFEIMIA
ncbi:nucleotidyltransferase domain-containing protein [Candidatus Woesearchaeota archaeon]|nr:nucleotidyltransferase domain-containing protein [Candidatus Woesearchaeota archaeon]